MKTEFKIGEVVILNNLAIKGLPDRVGQRAKVINILYHSPNYDYDLEFDDSMIAPVKYTEINKLTDEDEQYMKYIFTGNTVQSKLIGETVHIEKVDYLHKKVEIQFGDGSCTVTDFDDLLPIHIDSLEEISVSNSERYKQLLQEKYEVYVRKNTDYGNSFEDQFNEYGLLSAIIRLDDKLRRLKQLRISDAKVKDESIRDTALDLANYADMLVMVLDKLSK